MNSHLLFIVFGIAYILVDIEHPQERRSVRTEDAVAVVERSVEEDPNESTRRCVQQL